MSCGLMARRVIWGKFDYREVLSFAVFPKVGKIWKRSRGIKRVAGSDTISSKVLNVRRRAVRLFRPLRRLKLQVVDNRLAILPIARNPRDPLETLSIQGRRRGRSSSAHAWVDVHVSDLPAVLVRGKVGPSGVMSMVKAIAGRRRYK